MFSLTGICALPLTMRSVSPKPSRTGCFVSVSKNILGSSRQWVYNATRPADSGFSDANGACLWASYAGNRVSLATSQPVDVTNLSVLYYSITLGTNHGEVPNTTKIGFSSTQTCTDDFTIAAQEVRIGAHQARVGTVDVSALTGEYYLKIHVLHGGVGSPYTSHTYIHELLAY